MNTALIAKTCTATQGFLRTPGTPVNRDAATHMREIERLVQNFDRKQLALENSQALRGGNELLRNGFRQFYNPEEMLERKKWARSLPSDSQRTIEASLKQAELLGPMRRVAVAPSARVLDILLIDFPNFAEVTRLIQRRLALCRCAPEQLFGLPPILLDGPPGVGKTAYSKRLAKILAIAYDEVDISKGSASFAITGLDSGYSNGRAGSLWNTLNSGDGCMSCLILLDELDKSRASRDDHLGFLYGLLEPESATRFQDSALLLPIDASRISWIATCNDTDRVDSALLSRFEVLRVELPTKEEMPTVVASIHRELLSKSDWSCAFDPNLSGSIVELLSGHSPRLIRRALEAAYANAAFHGRHSLKRDDLQFRGEGCRNARQPMGFIHNGQ